MKLYSSPTSPYVRKVRMLLIETGLDDRVEQVAIATTPIAPDAAIAAANPLGKIPCLERPDGPAIFDSRVICRYLDSLHPGRKFYPRGPAEWTAATLEALADGMLDAAVIALYESRLRPAEAQFQPWVDAQILKITRSLDALETLWIAHLGGPLDAGGLATGVALGYLDFRYGALDWRATRPKLAAWHEGFAALDSYRATMPPA